MDTTTESMNESTTAESARPSYSELAKMVNEIAKPLAGRKLTKTLRKTAKKGAYTLRKFSSRFLLLDQLKSPQLEFRSSRCGDFLDCDSWIAIPGLP